MEHSGKIIEVAAPSRLHFGMFSFGRGNVRQFGGVGMMIDRPGVRLRFSPAERFHTSGAGSERVEQFAAKWAANSRAPLPLVKVEISAPAQHSGLGVGTQLALATAAGLNVVSGRPRGTAIELAALVERGLRSSVGIYGFDHGGLIVDHGKLPGEAIAPEFDRLPVPDAWRVVLIRPQMAEGLSGGDEQEAFASLPPVPENVTADLWRVAGELMRAVESADFDRFAETVYEFGQEAGFCFARIQGGAYNGPLLTEIVATARQFGVRGVGQSSWGPTIFCLLRDERKAVEFVARLQREMPNFVGNLTVAAPANAGAQVRPLA